jgi:hypothetical protein
LAPSPVKEYEGTSQLSARSEGLDAKTTVNERMQAVQPAVPSTPCTKDVLSKMH